MNNLAKNTIEIPVYDGRNYEFTREAQREMRTILYFRKGMSMPAKENEEKEVVKNSRRPEIPVWERSSLTIDQAAVYSGVGRDKIREITERDDCTFVLYHY